MRSQMPIPSGGGGAEQELERQTAAPKRHGRQFVRIHADGWIDEVHEVADGYFETFITSPRGHRESVFDGTNRWWLETQLKSVLEDEGHRCSWACGPRRERRD